MSVQNMSKEKLFWISRKMQYLSLYFFSSADFYNMDTYFGIVENDLQLILIALNALLEILFFFYGMFKLKHDMSSFYQQLF